MVASDRAENSKMTNSLRFGQTVNRLFTTIREMSAIGELCLFGNVSFTILPELELDDDNASRNWLTHCALAPDDLVISSRVWAGIGHEYTL